MISSDRLDPGSVGRIKVTVDTWGRTGHLEKHVVVSSNDKTTPVLTLTLSMDVVKK